MQAQCGSEGKRPRCRRPHGSCTISGNKGMDSDNTGTLSSGKKETGEIFNENNYDLLSKNSSKRIIKRGLRQPPFLFLWSITGESDTNSSVDTPHCVHLGGDYFIVIYSGNEFKCFHFWFCFGGVYIL